MPSILRKNYDASGVVPPYRAVKFDTVKLAVVLATAAADKVIGGSGRFGASVAGDRIEVTRLGFEEFELGGTVAAGDPLVADANGRLVVATPAAGANVWSIGQAEVAGVNLDVIKVLVSPMRIQG